MMTQRQEAEKDGWTVDRHVYPWLAYKGPRFNPTHRYQIETDSESERRHALEVTRKQLDVALRMISRALDYPEHAPF